MREDEPATGHIGCHDHFVAQSAHGKRRSGLAERDREGAGAHADADARWPAGRDPAQGLTQVHPGGYGDVHNIADAAD